jgi:hypothetical protein
MMRIIELCCAVLSGQNPARSLNAMLTLELQLPVILIPGCGTCAPGCTQTGDARMTQTMITHGMT